MHQAEKHFLKIRNGHLIPSPFIFCEFKNNLGKNCIKPKLYVSFQDFNAFVKSFWCFCFPIFSVTVSNWRMDTRERNRFPEPLNLKDKMSLINSTTEFSPFKKSNLHFLSIFNAGQIWNTATQSGEQNWRGVFSPPILSPGRVWFLWFSFLWFVFIFPTDARVLVK